MVFYLLNWRLKRATLFTLTVTTHLKKMTDEQIGVLINELRSKKNYNEAYIGYFQYGGGPDESYIKANRQGLELHAAELLAAALETETEFEIGKQKTFGLDEGISDEESDFGFNYIELKKEKRNDIKAYSEYKETWKDNAFKVGCIGIGILLVVLVIIGFIIPRIFSTFSAVVEWEITKGFSSCAL